MKLRALGLALAILGTALQAGSARAAGGGWVSSGGELFQLAKNPWFVVGKKGGTTEVRYCMQIDASAFSATEAKIQAAIETAVTYWKQELQQGAADVVRAGFTVLGTQSFILQPACDEKSDIRFLFGYGALSPAEIEALVDPTRYVGVTVRTDYDPVQLRGKGFVYISGDKGAKAYVNRGDLVKQAWEQQRLLEYILIHEIGHIMGIPHTGTGLMSEVFPEQLLHKRFSQFYLSHPLQSFLNPPLSFEVCQLAGSFHPGFFKITGPSECISLSGSRASNGELRWELSYREKKGSPLKPLGTIRAQHSTASALGARPAVVIHLPDEQSVFSWEERLLNGYILGPIFAEGTAKGAFRLANSIDPSELLIELHPDSVTMVGVIDGRPMPVLMFSPPSLLKMLFPIDI